MSEQVFGACFSWHMHTIGSETFVHFAVYAMRIWGARQQGAPTTAPKLPRAMRVGPNEGVKN